MKEALLDHTNPYRAIQGTLFRNADVAKWDSVMYDKFLTFVERFYDDEKGKISVTNDKIQELEKEMRDPLCTHNEFMYRIDQWFVTDLESRTLNKKFYPRLTTMMRIVFGYIKKHPHVLSEEIIERIKDKPQFAWCANLYKVQTTAIGADIITTDMGEYKGNNPGVGITTANADKLMMESLVKLASLYNTIASSFSDKELRSMPTKDRLAALQKLSFIFSATKNYKPNSQVFKQLNVYHAGREELEKALLDFGQDER